MSFEKTFCSSPWFHMRITNDGNYSYCRWSDKTDTVVNIQDANPKKFFQLEMEPVRQDLLAGRTVAGCQECQKMEQHGKVSGRQRQLLKIGVDTRNFAKTLASSPWVPALAASEFAQMPQDWQIDLGNYCNSACVFCIPESSSRLATEWQRIGFIDQLPPPNWTDDPELVSQFIDALRQSPHIQYLHFIGGETLLTPAFKTILSALIDSGLNQTATIGFTTNLTVWDRSVIDLLTQFQGVNLGVSIEAMTTVNDYVRWPAKLHQVLGYLQQWQELALEQNWLFQIRTTPTLFTVGHLLEVYQYAWDHKLNVESCNFLEKPEFMRPSVLPMSYRQPVIDAMQAWVDQHRVTTDTVINTRDPNVVHQQLVQDLQSYVNYLRNEPDESHRLPELVAFVKRLDSHRCNSVLNYLPEYEELFRTAGY